MGYIYCITSPSLKQYIGQTKENVEERFKGHQKKSSNCTLLKRAAKKYGWEHMVVEILVECPDEDLDKNEIECIELYRTLAPEGYNCTTGGETKKEYSEFTRKKMSNSAKKAIREGRSMMPRPYQPRRGTVGFCKSKSGQKKWRARSAGSHPRGRHIGWFKTEEEARIALEKYKKK